MAVSEWHFNEYTEKLVDNNNFKLYILQIIGVGLFIMTVWIRAEPSFEEWVKILDIYVYYIGIYILIVASVIVLLVSFLGCCSALMEHTSALLLVSVYNFINDIPFGFCTILSKCLFGIETLYFIQSVFMW